jgi:hypothetical protein
MVTRLFKKYLTVLVFLSVGLTSAFAKDVSLNIDWSGASFGNSATATGSITFNDVNFSNSLNHVDFSDVSALNVSIFNTSSGNSNLNLTNFNNIYFNSPSALDLSKQLIGQTLSNGCQFGTSTGPCGNGKSGDFNLFGNKANGVWYFNLRNNSGEQMLVTSITAAVPEPETYAMLLAGIGIIGAAIKRRKAKQA